MQENVTQSIIYNFPDLNWDIAATEFEKMSNKVISSDPFTIISNYSFER